MSRASRRALLAGALSAGAGTRRTAASPSTLRVLVTVDGLRELAPILADFAAARPDLLLTLTVREEDPAWIGMGLALEVGARQPSADLVLTGVAGLALGSAAGLWQSLPTRLRVAGIASMNRMARLMLPQAGDVAIMIASGPGGPLLLHRSSMNADPPRSAAALMEYARQNPGRFLYTRPSESPLGQDFVTALPYLLGDSDPTDPQSGWTRSWEWLAEMGRYISYYPATGQAALEELAENGIGLLPAPLATFLRGRTTGPLPEDMTFTTFENGPLIPHGMYLAVPRHVPAQRLDAIEALAHFLLRPEIQTRAFGRGLLRGDPEFSPAGAGLLTEEERVSWGRALPPEAAHRIAALPLAPPLAATRLAFMLGRWEEQVGARHGASR